MIVYHRKISFATTDLSYEIDLATENTEDTEEDRKKREDEKIGS
jgi:hypothetical protein